MRRVIVSLIVVMFFPALFAIFSIAFNLNSGVSNYYMDINVLPNGDVNIRDLHYLKGSYNGEENKYSYEQYEYIKNFKGSLDDLKTQNMYNPQRVIINEVKLVPKKLINTFNNINDEGIKASLVSNARIGYNNVYTITDRKSYISVKTYNNTSKGFYTDYTYKNMAVKHKDVSELNINLFNNYNESIDNLVVYLHINTNKNLFKLYGHDCNVKIIDNTTAKLTLSNINANKRLDVRVLFDKDAINTSKVTNYSVQTKIAEIEEELVKNPNYGKTIVKVILYLSYIIFICLGFMDLFKKKNKEYNRNIPNIRNEYTNYILKGKVTINDFLASMVVLVDKGIITFEKIEGVDDYYIRHSIDADKLDDLDSCVLGALITGEVTKLSDIKAMAFIKGSPFEFCYTNWVKKVLKNAIEEKYYLYDNGSNIKTELIVENLIYFVLSLVVSILISNPLLGIVSIILILVTIISADFNLVRTEKGKIEYNNIQGLKNFINDFSRLDEKSIPEVKLWNKYLIYATSFGCADKVYEVLKMKAPDLSTNLNDVFLLSDTLSIIEKGTSIASYRSLSQLQREYTNNISTSSSHGSGSVSGGGGHSGGRF